jgi:hypothetical protein
MIKGEASMKQNIIYVGLDVDDTQYHGSTSPGLILECLLRAVLGMPSNVFQCLLLKS